MRKNNGYNDGYEKNSEQNEMKNSQQYYTSSYNDDKTKLMIMGVLFIVLAVWVISIRDVDYGNSIFNENNNKQEQTEEKDNFLKYLDIINSLATKSYEFVYSIEPDNEEEYFYLRGSIDGERSLYYKEWKKQEYIYLKKGSNYYTMGVNTWKKTNKPLTYEGYDTLLYNTQNMYKLLNAKKSYEIKTEDGNTSIYVTVDLNKLLDIYNESAELDKQVTKLEDDKTFVNIKMYTQDNVLNVEMDLRDYYKTVYGKEVENMFYSFEYSKVGSTSLAGIEDYVITQ